MGDIAFLVIKFERVHFFTRSRFIVLENWNGHGYGYGHPSSESPCFVFVCTHAQEHRQTLADNSYVNVQLIIMPVIYFVAV